MSQTPNRSETRRFYVVTGPTSGYGLATARELAKHGSLVLVGRDRAKLENLQKEFQGIGSDAVIVVCDLSDMDAVRRAADQIAALKLPIAGVLNNAGVMQTKPTTNGHGWDMSYATNALGPLVLTEALIPHLADGTSVTFVVSAVEDPERPSAKMAGFRGGRYVSAEASARGEWKPGGSKNAGFDAYATSKQVALVNALELAEKNPKLRINAVEPGFTTATGLGRDAPAILRFLGKYLFGLVAPFMQGSTTVKKASLLLARIVVNTADSTGVYFDEKGNPMQPSQQVLDKEFRQRVFAETHTFLATAERINADAKQDGPTSI